MGCGHSKINIYPRKSKDKNTSKKLGNSNNTTNNSGSANNGFVNGRGDNGASDGDAKAILQKQNSDNDNTITTVSLQNSESQDDTSNNDSTTGGAKVKLKSHVGGPLSAHMEISESQLNFFRMLDEKIENGPDYDSSSETEQAKKNERLTSLLQDWETASAASRSIQSTPTKQNYQHHRQTSTQYGGPIIQQQNQTNASIKLSHNVYPVQYAGGTSVALAKTQYNPNYQSCSPPSYHSTINTMPVTTKIVSGMQYSSDSLNSQQQIKQNLTNFVAQRQFQIAQQYQQQTTFTNYASNSYSPVHKHASQSGQQQRPIPIISNVGYLNNSPLSVRNSALTSEEVLIQQQMYNQQLKYQQSREMQQYKQNREQVMYQTHPLQTQPQQQLIVQTHTIAQPQQYKPVRIISYTSNNDQQSYSPETSSGLARSSTASANTPNSPKMMYRKQYPQELT